MLQPLAHHWSGTNLSSITVALEEEKMWRDFGAHTTEMIVTKPGRKVFPKLNLKIGGLNPQVLYGLRITIQRVDQFKYRFQAGRWRPCGEEDEEVGKAGNVVYHRDGFIQSGHDWMKRPIDFNHFKLTNSKEMDEKHMVFAESLHKYIPIVDVTDEFNRILTRETLHVASFITVTAYQNPFIKQLKKNYNPYAAGQLKKSEKDDEKSPALSRKRPSGSPIRALQAPPTQATPTQNPPSHHGGFPTPTTTPPMFPYYQTQTPPTSNQSFPAFPTPSTPTTSPLQQLTWQQTPQRMAHVPPQFPLTPITPSSGLPLQYNHIINMNFPNQMMLGQTPTGFNQNYNPPACISHLNQYENGDYALANMFVTNEENDKKQ